jgi:hypothetical protein
VVTSASSFRDPENFAVHFEGEWFRIAQPASAKALHKLRQSDVGQQLLRDGDVISFEPVDADESAKVLAFVEQETSREITGASEVFRVETFELITYPWEWPNYMLAAAADLTLRIRDSLLDIGLDLKDASALNIQFQGTQAVLIDIGSIEPWRPNPSWNAARQFIEHFINPLAVGSSKHVTSADAWRVSQYRGLRSDVARSLMASRQRRKPALALLQAMTRPVQSNKPSETRYAKESQENPELALRATKSLNRRLAKAVRKLNSGIHETTWADYGSRDHYDSVALEAKYALTREFIARQPDRSDLIVDVGGNDGLIGGKLADEFQARVVVMDADAGALDALVASIGKTSSLLTPMIGDLTNPFPSSGLLQKEFSSIFDRLKPSAVLCQAVLHHIVITQGVPMQYAVDALAEFGAPLQIEFALPEDAKVKILLNQIPNWSGEYSQAALLAALETRYDRVTIDGSTSATRIMVSAEDRK